MFLDVFSYPKVGNYFTSWDEPSSNGQNGFVRNQKRLNDNFAVVCGRLGVGTNHHKVGTRSLLLRRFKREREMEWETNKLFLAILNYFTFKCRRKEYILLHQIKNNYCNRLFTKLCRSRKSFNWESKNNLKMEFFDLTNSTILISYKVFWVPQRQC